MKEETGLDVGALRLIGVYSDPNRDPRGHTCSIAYLAHVDRAEPRRATMPPRPNGSPTGAPKLAFDHAQILTDAEKLIGSA